MTNDEATEQLQALLKVRGALRIIKPFHACQPGKLTDLAVEQDRRLARDGVGDGRFAAACDEYAARTGHDLKRPAHYEVVAVKRLEGPDERGRLTAYADDGPDNTTCRGEPAALLARLVEHNR